MDRTQRLKYEMFVRARSFGVTNRDVFPESTSGGQKFAQLAAVVESIEEHLVRRSQARAEARKVKTATRRATMDFMKAIASTGRQAADEEKDPHPFRMPLRRSATIVLNDARMFLEEATKRKEKFVELGMAPTFLEDFGALIDSLEAAVGTQQDSRGARRSAQAGIETALVRGMKLINQLDVTVANVLRTDPVRLAQWQGARRIDNPPSPGATKPVSPVAPTVATPVEQQGDTPEEVLKVAS